MKNYSEYDKAKYVRGFKKSHYTLREYCKMMDLPIENMKEWVKNYKETPTFGKINVAEIMAEKEASVSPSPIRFESDTIKIELKPNYDKEFLKSIIEVMVGAE